MPLVHEAAERVRRAARPKEKDQGFVIEFRERPTLLASLTKRAGGPRSARSARRAPTAATALFDAVVLALYQFRAVPGRKAIVVLSDGDDNHSWTRLRDAPPLRADGGHPDLLHRADLRSSTSGSRPKLKELAADTGAEAFFVGKAAELPEIYRKIETELRSQYFVQLPDELEEGRERVPRGRGEAQRPEAPAEDDPGLLSRRPSTSGADGARGVRPTVVAAAARRARATPPPASHSAASAA